LNYIELSINIVDLFDIVIYSPLCITIAKAIEW